MKQRSLPVVTTVLALGAVGVAHGQSEDRDRAEREAALLNAATIENAFRSVEQRIQVTDAAQLWEDEWNGRSDPPAGDWWLESWSERGLTARYCDGVLAVYAGGDELKGVGRDQRAVQVAPVAYGNGRTGLHLIQRGTQRATGAHGRRDAALPSCVPVLSTTNDRVGLVGAVADPKRTEVGLRWETEDRTVACPVASDTGSLTERRRIPVQVTAVTNCGSGEPNCNDLAEQAGSPPAWPQDCGDRASTPGLPPSAACSDWVRWRSNCQIVYAAAPPAADIPDPVVTWEDGGVYSWTSACSCPSGQTGSCTEHWEQNTEIRVFALTPDTPDADKVRTRQPARGTAGRRRLVNTVDNCRPIVVNDDGPGGGDPGGGGPGGGDGPGGGGPGGSGPGGGDGPGGGGPGGGGPGGGGSGGGTTGSGEVGGIGGVDGGVTGGHSPGQSNGNGNNGDDGDANGSGGGGKPIVLDLDGDGVELVPLEKSTARYDIDGDGERERMAWAAPDDGFLAYDADGDGAIEGKDELSFLAYVEHAETDLEGLRHFDTDGDGRLDPDDAGWGRFRVWRDLDQDGESDAGELRSLDEAGIRSVGLTSDGVKRVVAGNTVYGEGVYVGPGGRRTFWDVVLQTAPRVE